MDPFAHAKHLVEFCWICAALAADPRRMAVELIDALPRYDRRGAN